MLRTLTLNLNLWSMGDKKALSIKNLNVGERGIFRKKGILGINVSLFKSFLQLILPIIRISTVLRIQ
jgi:hypothetical protein